VRAIAEAHGGGISVGVARERGALLILRLPLAPSNAIVS
jgi:signal transduction histidine kinase